MPLVTANKVTLDFPIYGANTRSLKNRIIKSATGGTLAKDSGTGVMVRALDNVSFEMHEGDRIGIIGHNGAGKSTLLRVLAGIYEVSDGSINVKGRITSMLSITLGMDMEATGLEYIYVRGYILGVKKNVIKKMIDDIVDFSGIGDYLYLPIRTYSSGMIMRLAFAVSTAVQTDIVLMDEWLSVGDEEFMAKAKQRLKAMMEKSRIVVLASHDLELIKDQSTKIFRLDHGLLSVLSKELI